jgi:hypothetical protein
VTLAYNSGTLSTQRSTDWNNFVQVARYGLRYLNIIASPQCTDDLLTSIFNLLQNLDELILDGVTFFKWLDNGAEVDREELNSSTKLRRLYLWVATSPRPFMGYNSPGDPAMILLTSNLFTAPATSTSYSDQGTAKYQVHSQPSPSRFKVAAVNDLVPNVRLYLLSISLLSV